MRRFSTDGKETVMVSVYKRGTKLYLQFYVNGKRRQRTTGLDDTPANRKLLKQKVIPKLEAKIASGELELEMQKKEVETLKKYADLYMRKRENRKTWHEILQKVKEIEAHFGKETDVRNIRRKDVLAWVDSMLQKRTPKTTRGYVGILHGVLHIAVDYEVLATNPAEDIDLPNHIKKEFEPFSTEEVAAILEASDGWFRNLLAVLFYTGMRTGEALALMRRDIDLDNMTMSVERSVSKNVVSEPKTKSGIRSVPILAPLVPYVDEQLDLRNDSLYLFPGKNGGPMRGADSIRKKWIDTLDKAGVRFRKLYATRHTFITAMLKSETVSVLELAQIVGHANAEMIMKNYAKFITGEHLRISRKIDPFACKSADTIEKILK